MGLEEFCEVGVFVDPGEEFEAACLFFMVCGWACCVWTKIYDDGLWLDTS